MVSPHISTRATPVRGTPMTRYVVLLNGREIHGQLSALSAADVASAVARFEEQQRQARIAKTAKASPKGPTHSRCRRCDRVKPLEAFALDFSVSAGRKRVCKACSNAKRRAAAA